MPRRVVSDCGEACCLAVLMQYYTHKLCFFRRVRSEEVSGFLNIIVAAASSVSLIQIDLKKISYCRIRPDITIDKKFKLNLSALLRYVCTSARNLLATHIWYSCIDCGAMDHIR